MTARIPRSVDVPVPDVGTSWLFWMDEIEDTWDAAASELFDAFRGSREAAISESSIVFIVRNDDLIGRSGLTRAMVSSGLVSGARTAALEGARKGWTCNVIAYDVEVPGEVVIDKALWVLDDGSITGELIHLGPGHIGKALI